MIGMDDTKAVANLSEMRPEAAVQKICTGLILGLCQGNERRRYYVTTSLIGWAQAQEC